MKSLSSGYGSLFSTEEAAKTYPARTVIFSQGQKFGGVYYVVKGSVLISKVSGNNKRFNLWSAGAGELIGLTSYFNSAQHYSFSAKVISNNASLVFIGHERFRQMLETDPILKKELMKMLCVRITMIENQTQYILNCNSRQRVAKLILSMVGVPASKRKNHDPIHIHYDRAELAVTAGVKPSYLEKLMAELKEQKILHRRHGQIIINDLPALMKFSATAA